MNGTNGDGGSNDVPWASVFDSAANMRALSAIQADGFRAASELVDRFVRMASAGVPGTQHGAPSATRPSADQPGDFYGATGLEPLITSWWTMFDQFLRVGAARDGESTGQVRASLDFATARSAGLLRLEADARGSAADEFWLHNGGPDDFGKVRLRCSDLLAHDGTVVPAARLRLEPDVVPMLARSSRGVTVGIELDGETAPGHYRGTLVVDGHPDLWLPVELVIAPLEP